MNQLGLIFRLGLKSLWSRRVSALLAALSIALSVALILSVERVKEAARASFAGTISDVDLVVGARSGGVQLLLYSVFRLGSATNNVTWTTYREIAAHPAVDWILPLSLGDSHRGFRVMGVTDAYYEKFRYRRGERLVFAEGAKPADLFDAAIGADVAAALDYAVGDRIVVAHGIGRAELSLHDDKPFRVSGILEKTGTPVDRTVHVSLEAIEAIHVDWRSGARIPGMAVSAEAVREMDLTPRAVTAALVKLKSRLQVFEMQRFVNDYRDEPLTAVLPGVALQELWSVIGVGETALAIVSAAVLVAAALGLAMMLLATLGARRGEMAILRSVGAGPGVVAALLMSEAALITLGGLVLGLGLHVAVILGARDWLDAAYGVYIDLAAIGPRLWAALGLAALVGVLSGIPPAIGAYRLSARDGLGLRL